MARTKKCNLGEHQDRRMRGGKSIQCTTCLDVFPCKHDCEHFDCMLATNRPLPEWVNGFDMADAAAVVAEAMGGIS